MSPNVLTPSMQEEFEKARESAKRSARVRSQTCRALKKLEVIQRRIDRAGGPFQYVKNLK